MTPDIATLVHQTNVDWLPVVVSAVADQPQATLSGDLPAVGLVLLAALFVAVVLWLSPRHRTAALWVIAASVGLSVLIGYSVGHKPHSSPETSQIAQKMPRTIESSSPASNTPREQPNAADPGDKASLDDLPNSAAIESSPLPDWTRQLKTSQGATTLAVVRSGRFASRDEAEQHALDEAVRIASQHFRHLDPRGIGDHNFVQRDLIKTTAIRQRHDEISRHDLGAMKDHPMHQVWLQVELSPDLGRKLAAPWRDSAVAARLKTLISWGVWLTAAAAVITLALRLDSASQGERRRLICFVTVFVIVSSLALIG